ncbi:MAG: hypothetical protein JWR88_631 [Pseudonocardia sp.]|nr:hypothetical protein [Pseudonocardia sp.]
MTTATERNEMPVLENMAVGIAPADGRYFVRAEPIAKRVRAVVGDVAVADSTHTLMMWEAGRLCVYYFPIDDVRTDLLSASGTIVNSSHKGGATYYSVTVGEHTIDDAAWRYLAPADGTPDVAGYIAFHWKYMDHWFEEDEEVFVHARDPYHRLDVLQSSRRVEVIIGGATVADTSNAMILFETSLPPRYYIPKQDVRFELLALSRMQTGCAYKGPTSAYWSAADSHRPLAWCYETPWPEVSRIAGRIAFFNERVDAIKIDGVTEIKPITPWS